MDSYNASILKSTKGIVIAARPDHSGWFNNLDDLIHGESCIYYVGLEKNLNTDVSNEVELIKENVGEDGENLWKVIRNGSKRIHDSTHTKKTATTKIE